MQSSGCMNWLTRGTTTVCNPYRIVQTSRGFFEAWIFSKSRSGVLGREIATLGKAKALCEKDLADHTREPA